MLTSNLNFFLFHSNFFQSNDEFRKVMNGYQMKNSLRYEGITFLPPSNLGDLPDTVDWRTKGYVTGVKNQVSGLWAKLA